LSADDEFALLILRTTLKLPSGHATANSDRALVFAGSRGLRPTGDHHNQRESSLARSRGLAAG